MLTFRAAAAAVAIVADDLTGAGDAAAPFADLGWHTTIRLDGVFAPGDRGPRLRPTVEAVVTDSRARDADTARALTSGAVSVALTAGLDRLFVKIDSTVRGPLVGQVGGALDAWQRTYPDAIAVVCPAYPAMGRTVVDGDVLVDGLAAEQSPAGQDPRTPVVSGDLTALLPGSRRISLGSGDSSSLADLVAGAAAARTRVLVVDASSDHDLDMIAEAVAQLGPHVVAVGSAGLSTALARAWSGRHVVAHPRADLDRARRVLVVVSSLHETARRQCDRLSAALPGRTVRAVEPRDVRHPPQADVRADRPLEDAPADVLVVVTPTVPASARVADPDAVLTALGHATRLLFDTPTRPDGLVLVGGDGARAVLRRLDAVAVEVVGTLREGVPVGRIVGGTGDGLTVATKAGGFGGDGLVAEIVDTLLNDHHEGATR